MHTKSVKYSVHVSIISNIGVADLEHSVIPLNKRTSFLRLGFVSFRPTLFGRADVLRSASVVRPVTLVQKRLVKTVLNPMTALIRPAKITRMMSIRSATILRSSVKRLTVMAGVNLNGLHTTALVGFTYDRSTCETDFDYYATQDRKLKLNCLKEMVQN
jgi:hypothetical protein